MTDVMDGIMRSEEELKEAFHYHKVKLPPCCRVCFNRHLDVGGIFCVRIGGDVDQFGVCDKYELPF
jgi:hypothetical protein